MKIIFCAAIGVKRNGEPIIIALKIDFDVVTILKNEAFAGLWEYIKEHFNDLKASISNAIMGMILGRVI